MQKESFNSVRVFYPEFNLQDLIIKISNNLSGLAEKLNLKLIVLFGSYARGNYTISSDVDLLVVHDSPLTIDVYKLLKKSLNIPRIELHIYSLKEYENLKETIERMTRNGVVLLNKI